jgi:hypothetical protein
MRRAAVIVTIGLAVMAGTPAHAEPSGEGRFCDVQPALCAEMGDHGDAPTGEVTRRTRELPRFFWREAELTGWPTCSGPDGRQLFLWLVDRATNQVIGRRFRCPDPTVHGAAATLPPVPPAPEAVWGQAPLPTPEVRTNPQGDGLTGLPTWLWYDQPTTASLTVQLGEFTVILNARAVHYRWRMGDGTEVTTATPGTAQAPAGTHVYEGKGDYTVSLDVTWAGTYTFSGPATAPITIDLGERTFTGQRLYHVVEIRGVRQ